MALAGTPPAWREPGARPAELFSARYWAGLAVEAERGLLDFATFEDALSLQPADRAARCAESASSAGVGQDEQAAEAGIEDQPGHCDRDDAGEDERGVEVITGLQS
jgi:hypothetical protein